MSKILFHLGHPAHFHLFKHTITRLTENGHHPLVVIKKKDVLEDLLNESSLPYYNILPTGKSDGKFGMVKDLFKRGSKLIAFTIKQKPDLLVGTSPDISYTGKLLGIPSLNVNEDNTDVVPLYAKLAYPWATKILSPDTCNNGKWQHKTISYNGYHELAYLHPNHFTPDISIVQKYIDSSIPFFILRFSNLKAHHDQGIKGVSNDMIKSIIEILKPHGRILITSERPLIEDLNSYMMKIKASDMHHFLAFAHLIVGDSQTMSAEAGVLGTPFIRYNDFVGRIGYLNELENYYKLGYGFSTNKFEQALECVAAVIHEDKITYKFRLERMLSEKLDTSLVIYDTILKMLSV
jgi:uncharacterized protein